MFDKKKTMLTVLMLLFGVLCIFWFDPSVKALGWTTPDAIHSFCGEDEWHPAIDTIDENTGTYWKHVQTHAHWIVFDMGESDTISKIRIYQYGGSAYRFGKNVGLYVYVSDDPEAFGDPVWEGVLDAGGWQESGSFSKVGRYVKLLSKSLYLTQYIYEFDAYIAPPNATPENDSCTITDMDDTDNLYAQKKLYTVEYGVSDDDGFADIDYAEARFKQAAVTRAIFRYDEDTNTFSIQSGSGEWTLDGSSSAVESGTTIDVTFKIMAQWDATEESALEIECYVVDAQAASDTDTMQTDYFDVVTNLVTGSIECTDANDPDRVDISATVQIDFTVRYANNPGSGTASSNYPPDAEFTSVSIYDSANNNEGTDATIVNGAGSVSFTAPSAPGSDTYNLYINMVDGDYTDGEETTTETIITDRITWLTGTLETTDAHINYDATGEWYGELKYEFDNAEVTDGTVTLNTDSMSWDAGQGRWEYTNAPAAVVDIARNIASVSGNTYGITALNSAVTSDSETIEYDMVVFLTETFETVDARLNFDANGEWHCKLMLDNNDVTITAGTITLNTGALTYDSGADARWEYTYSLGSVGDTSRNIASVSGLTGGITAIDAAVTGDSETIVFDRRVVYWEELDDAEGRVDINTNIEGRYRVVLDYDDHVVGSGDTLSCSWGALAWDAGNNWWDISHSEATVTSVTITGWSGTENTYDITAITENFTETDYIYDRGMAYWEQVDTTRLDVDTNAEWRVRAVLEYDQHPLGSGDTLSCSWGALAWDAGNSWFEISHTESSVGSYTISLTACSEATYGISVLAENITETSVIFDQLLQTFQANTTNPGLNEPAEICWCITRKYDGSIVNDFSFDLARNSTLWESSLSNSSVTDVRSENGTWVYSCNGTIIDNTYGLQSYTDTAVTVSWGISAGGVVYVVDLAQPYDLATGVAIGFIFLPMLIFVVVVVRRKK